LHTIIERTRNELASMIYGEGNTGDPNTPKE
jgi:hypothetical protein